MNYCVYDGTAILGHYTRQMMMCFADLNLWIHIEYVDMGPGWKGDPQCRIHVADLEWTLNYNRSGGIWGYVPAKELTIETN